MMHKMSEVRGWSHNDMMEMDKPTFFRYYGYWLAERLEEEANHERDEAKRKLEAKRNERNRM